MFHLQSQQHIRQVPILHNCQQNISKLKQQTKENIHWHGCGVADANRATTGYKQNV